MKSGKPGGGAGGMNKRVNPMTNKRVKLVSFWSGILKADASGTVNYEVDVPQFSGNLKIMAIAYKGKSFGAKSDDMTVADPIVLSTALPRFLSPGDKVEVPVTISNTTKNTASCNAEIKVSGAVTIDGEKSKLVKINAEGEQQVLFKLNAKKEIGQAKITVSVNSGGKKYFEEIDITVRPASPLQKVSGSGSVDAGKNLHIAMGTSRFMPTTIDRKLIIGTSPLVEFTEDLSYLLKYPYGCVEQTVSSVFPQLYYQELVKNVFTTSSVHKNPVNNINVAIDKLKMMQLYNGGLTYWPGGGRESWWGTVYAAHFLIEAKKAGYDIDDDFLNNIYRYLEKKVKKRETLVYYFNRDKNKKIAPKELAYSIYVLALAQKPQMSTMNYYKANRDLLSLDSKYLLATSYALAGDKEKFAQIVPQAFEGEESVQVFGGSFYSPIRDKAIALNALLEVDPSNQQIGIMARHLAQKLKSKQYLNTQERAFSFLAMGKIAKNAAKSNITADISVSGKKVKTYKKGMLTLSTKDLQSDDIKINATGKGKLYYFWEAEGIASDGSYIEEDKFIKVRRGFYDRKGNLITNNKFKQNDLVVVKLSVTGADKSTQVKNVVITDILPAGFEIENPRLTNSRSFSWIKNKSRPEYMDIRDDRINYFTTVTGYVKNFYYLVRCVSPGEFNIGPVGADAMYNGEYHSYNGGGKVIIRK